MCERREQEKHSHGTGEPPQATSPWSGITLEFSHLKTATRRRRKSCSSWFRRPIMSSRHVFTKKQRERTESLFRFSRTELMEHRPSLPGCEYSCPDLLGVPWSKSASKHFLRPSKTPSHATRLSKKQDDFVVKGRNTNLCTRERTDAMAGTQQLYAPVAYDSQVTHLFVFKSLSVNRPNDWSNGSFL